MIAKQMYSENSRAAVCRGNQYGQNQKNDRLRVDHAIGGG